MPLNAGRLNRRITIEQRTAGVDAWGQRLTTWTTVATCWADVRAMSGSAAAERVAADRETSVTAYSMRIRWRTDVTAGMRVSMGTTRFDIVDVIEDQAGREYVDLVCQQGGSDGG